MIRLLKSRRGFTLVEIMIVVAIIGLLAAIAIPNFIKSRNRSRTALCINNMKQIASALEQVAMEKNLNPVGAAIVATWSALPSVPPAAATWGVVGPLGYIKVRPTCPIVPAAVYTAAGDANGVIWITCLNQAAHLAGGSVEFAAPAVPIAPPVGIANPFTLR